MIFSLLWVNCVVVCNSRVDLLIFGLLLISRVDVLINLLLSIWLSLLMFVVVWGGFCF